MSSFSLCCDIFQEKKNVVWVNYNDTLFSDMISSWVLHDRTYAYWSDQERVLHVSSVDGKWSAPVTSMGDLEKALDDYTDVLLVVSAVEGEEIESFLTTRKRWGIQTVALVYELDFYDLWDMTNKTAKRYRKLLGEDYVVYASDMSCVA